MTRTQALRFCPTRILIGRKVYKLKRLNAKKYEAKRLQSGLRSKGHLSIIKPLTFAMHFHGNVYKDKYYAVYYKEK